MYVYFIRAGKKGPIKVGITNEVEKRLETLQTANAYKLEILALIGCRSRSEALNIEKKVHKFYRRQNIRGEWFTGDIDLKRMNERFGSYDYKYHATPKEVEDSDDGILASLPSNF